jgi:glutamine---fructose-6-phosphate transaminase (isomerizing)
MCGIIAYVGSAGRGFEAVFSGLRNLEHRGYDSAGALFCFEDGQTELYRISQKEELNFSIRDLSAKVKNKNRLCRLGIGHTRWASCGTVSEINAHPHCDKNRRVWVVHNGNVVNFDRLKREFPDGYFYSETDTELVANLIGRELDKGGDLRSAVESAMLAIEGPNAILAVSVLTPGELIAANRGGTLLYDRNAQGEFFIASDPAPLEAAGFKTFFPMGEEEILVIGENDKKTCFFSRSDDQISLEGLSAGQNFKHLMEKEIFEQPLVFAHALGGRMVFDDGITRFGGLEKHVRDLRSARRFHFLGCGTAYHACQYAVLLLNRFGIEAEAHISSEFCHSHKVFDYSDVFFVVSQSGETADSIKALKEIKIKGNPVFGIVNREGSRIWRETGAGIHIRAGAERAVASTKAFTCQLLSIAMLAVYLARQRKMTADTGQRIMRELESLPAKAMEIIKDSEAIGLLAHANFMSAKDFYFLGRYFNSVVASEGALKLKEVSYVHAESYPLGEMKHGPLALVDEKFVSVVIVTKGSTYEESLGNIREIKAREGKVIVVTDDELFDRSLCDGLILIPSTLDYLSPILSIIPLQLFAYYFALCLCLNPDKPRNLAKTVTVG